MTHFITMLTNFWRPASTSIFWMSAIVGTTLFILRAFLSFFTGTLFHDSVDVDIDIDDATIDIDHKHHTTAVFKFFTVHSLSGFLMIFGWAGLAASIQFKQGTLSSFFIALGCGSLMLIITGLLMNSVHLLEGQGAQFNINSTVGLVGSVYQQIPARGQGKIHLVVNNMTRELYAQSATQKGIDSFTLVKVVKVIDHDVVEVTELS